MKNLLVTCLFLVPLTVGTPIQGRAVTTQVLDGLERFAQWAFAAYCNSKRPVGQPVLCNPGECDLISTSNTVITATFDGLLSDIQGFLAIDSAANQIVLSIRGTHSAQNIVTDFVSGCGIHPGFATAWEEISDDVLAALQSATALYPAHDIIVTGHSLGGAVATIAAGHLRQEGFFIDLYTYGSPRVGNLAFVTFITNQDGEEYRVTHSDDPVPQVPPMFLSYRHVSPEYWIDSANTRATVTASTVTVCTGYSSTSCNAGTSGLDVGAHSWYFQQPEECLTETGLERLKRDENINDADLERTLSQYAAADLLTAKKLHDQGLE